MRLDEEARKLEDSTLRHAKRIDQPLTLKRIISEALTRFEECLKGLPTEEREEALVLYLDKIRRVTFSFHLAVSEQLAREKFGRSTEPDERKRILKGLSETMRALAALYRFL
jgi:hypothetical protein